MNGNLKIFLAVISAVLFLCGCGAQKEVYLERVQPEETEVSESGEVLPREDGPSDESGLSQEGAKPPVYYVYVCGAVLHPGVYELPEGSRVYEAVNQAGGLTADASADCINQAELVSDGQMIKILTVSEAENDVLDEQAAASDGLLDINRAGVADFMTLPGIGQSKAAAIVDYREEHGAFSSVDEIMNVDGIKEGVFNKIKDCIKV